MVIDMVVGYPALIPRSVEDFGGAYPVWVQRVDYFGNVLNGEEGPYAQMGPFHDKKALEEYCAKEDISKGPWRIWTR